MLFRWAAFYNFFWLLPLVCAALVYYVFAYKPATYTYALTDYLAKQGLHTGRWYLYILHALRLAAIGLLVLLAAKPQVGARSGKTVVEGIDIVLVIDGSGSMALFDDQYDRRSRLEIAKKEALRFIDQRPDDAVGLVVFGNGVLSACPLTHERSVLREIIGQLQVGSMVDDRCTLLSVGMLGALNRLRPSVSPSRVMIVLTDGQPSSQDVPVSEVLAIARRMHVRIYTVGVGDEQGGFFQGPMGMLLREGVQLNDALLQHIASQTGGRYFRAKNAAQMRAVYEEIDRLEKRVMPIDSPVNYRDILSWLGWLVLALVAGELVLRALIWQVLA